MQIGEVLGDIRKNKNLKSKEVYKGILSRPAISRFEKGHSDTTAEKFLQILENLNLSLEEFHFLYDGNKANTDAMMISAYSEAYYAKDIPRLAALEEASRNHFDETSQNIFAGTCGSAVFRVLYQNGLFGKRTACFAENSGNLFVGA